MIVVGCLVSGFGGVLFFSRTKAVSEGAKEQPATATGSHTSQARETCNYLGRGQ